MLRNLYKILVIVAIVYLVHYDATYHEIHKENIDNIIVSDLENRKYDGYIYIPKFDYKGIIMHGDEKMILDSNNVLFLNNGSNINDKFGNIVLAGHNSKYVFSILYKLSIGDTLVVNTYDYEYKFLVYEIKTINIKDTYILDNLYDKKILTLITCTRDNQRRLIVRAKI